MPHPCLKHFRGCLLSFVCSANFTHCKTRDLLSFQPFSLLLPCFLSSSGSFFSVPQHVLFSCLHIPQLFSLWSTFLSTFICSPHLHCSCFIHISYFTQILTHHELRTSMSFWTFTIPSLAKCFNFTLF